MVSLVIFSNLYSLFCVDIKINFTYIIIFEYNNMVGGLIQ